MALDVNIFRSAVAGSAAAIIAGLGFTPVNKAGDTMTGTLLANATTINLGSGANPFGDLFLKSTGKIDFGNGNAAFTHASDAFTLTAKTITTGRSINDEVIVTFLNSTSGTAARSTFAVSGGGVAVAFYALSPAYTPAGLFTASTAVMRASSAATGGLSLGTGGASTSVRIFTADVVRATFDATSLALTGTLTTALATSILGSTVTITGGATGNAPTLTAGPVTGNPTKWLPYNDNGTTRYIPSW